jgi:hypothetical protein
VTHGLSDTGKREEFGTGMIREPNLDRGRYDLITPIGLCMTLFNIKGPIRQEVIAEFLRRMAIHYERGAAKYSERNWEKGGPLSRHLNSAIRHLQNRLSGCRKEDHICACVWNLWCIVHHMECIQVGSVPDSINDLVHYGYEFDLSGVVKGTGILGAITNLYCYMWTSDSKYIYACIELCINDVEVPIESNN